MGFKGRSAGEWKEAHDRRQSSTPELGAYLMALRSARGSFHSHTMGPLSDLTRFPQLHATLTCNMCIPLPSCQEDPRSCPSRRRSGPAALTQQRWHASLASLAALAPRLREESCGASFQEDSHVSHLSTSPTPHPHPAPPTGDSLVSGNTTPERSKVVGRRLLQRGLGVGRQVEKVVGGGAAALI